jgi:hypothetical protein
MKDWKLKSLCLSRNNARLKVRDAECGSIRQTGTLRLVNKEEPCPDQDYQVGKV